MKTPPGSPACERNKRPILEVLRKELAGRRRVLEVGSGTGQHAVYFARHLPYLAWQTSDLAANHDVIRAWLASAGLPNVEPPLTLDVLDPAKALAGLERPDAVFSANTAHIMPVAAVQAMFELVGRLLPEGGVFCLYGPFMFDGGHSSPSNRAFDASLKARDPAMGIRDIAELDRYARDAGLVRVRLYAMPANNHLAVWERPRAARGGRRRAGAGRGLAL